MKRKKMNRKTSSVQRRCASGRRFCASRRRFCASGRRFCASGRQFCVSRRRFCASGRRFCAAVLVFWLGVCLLPGIRAYASVGQIDVTVGYFGMESYTKASPTLEELRENCGVNREIYTWIDNMPAAGTTEAEGVYLEDVMEYCGIDADSIGYYNFYTLDADSYAGAWESYPPGKLDGGYTFAACFEQALAAYMGRASDEDFDEHPENYYRLCDFYNQSDVRDEASYLPDAWQNRAKVKPMLALSKKTARWSGDYPASALDYSDMTFENMPQLLFGQAAENERTRGDMAKMVSRIHVWFEGSPTITGSIGELEGEIGSGSHIDVEVDTPDAYLTQKIKENIRWTSSDESVATVDEDGNVTFVGEGKASISAAYVYVDDSGNEQVLQGFSVGTTAKAGEEPGSGNAKQPEAPEEAEDPEESETPEKAEPPEEEPKEEEAKEPEKGPETSKNGDGNGSGTDGNAGESGGSRGTDADRAESSGRKGKEEYYLADGANTDLQMAMASAGGNGVKVYEIGDAAEGLPMEEEETPAAKAAGAMAIALFAAGILGKGLSFKIQKTRR